MYYVDSVINGKSEAHGFSIFHQANRRLEWTILQDLEKSDWAVESRKI